MTARCANTPLTCSKSPNAAARDAQHKRDAMYDTEILEAAINAAGNVKRLRSA